MRASRIPMSSASFSLSSSLRQSMKSLPFLLKLFGILYPWASSHLASAGHDDGLSRSSGFSAIIHGSFDAPSE